MSPRRRPSLNQHSSARKRRLRRLIRPSSKMAETYQRHWRLLEEQHQNLLYTTGVFWKLTLILITVLLGIRGSAFIFNILSVNTGDVVIDLSLTVLRSAVALLPFILALRGCAHIVASDVPSHHIRGPYLATAVGNLLALIGTGLFFYSFTTPFTESTTIATADSLSSLTAALLQPSPEALLMFGLGHLSNVALTLFSLSMIGLAVVLLFPIATLLQERLRQSQSHLYARVRRLIGLRDSSTSARACQWCSNTSFQVVEHGGGRVIRCQNCQKAIHENRPLKHR